MYVMKSVINFVGMMLVKVGGPVYRIGVGGGAASSVAVQGGDSRDHALDFGAVQRGNITKTFSKLFLCFFKYVKPYN